MFTFPTLLFCL